MPYCEACGEQVREEAEYCFNCGDSIIRPASVSTSDESFSSKSSSNESTTDGPSGLSEQDSEDEIEQESQVQSTELKIAIAIVVGGVILSGVGWEHGIKMAALGVALTFASLMGWA